MSEYERLTNQKWSKDIDLTQELGYSYIYKRLYELEDKIKAGTLVTVPYAIGQELYCVSLLCKDIEKVKVSLISIRQNGDIDIRLNYYTENGNYWSCFKYDPKYYELFNTKAKAKKRLEEIKDETNTL